MDIQWGNDSLFNSWCWQNWTATCKRMKLDHCLAPYTRVNSKWIKDLNLSHETIKLLEKKHRQKSLGHKHEQLLHELISPGKGNESKNEQVGLCQAEELLYSKGHRQWNKRYPTVWDNIFMSDKPDKGLTSKIYKELTHLNKHKANNPIKKWAEELNR